MSTPGDVTKRPLPPGWRWVKLGEVCELIIGRTPSRSVPDYWGGGLPWVTIADLNNGVITHTKETISQLGAFTSRCRLLKAGTILFSFKLTIGKMGVAGIDLYTNEAIAGVIPKEPSILSNDYLWFALQFINPEEDSSHAVKGKTLNQKTLDNLLIPLPPLAEQRRIVAILREQMAAVERARRAAEEQLEAAKALPAAFLRQVFPRPGQPLPPGWRWVRLEEVVTVFNGFWGNETESPGSRRVTVLGVGNISNDGFIRLEGAQERYLSEKELEAIVEEGDLLVVKSSGSATNIRSGKTGLCPPELSGKVACSNFMIRLVVKRDKAVPYLLWLILNSEHAKKFIQLIASSTTYPNIKWSSFKDLPIPLPPLAEQQRIATILREQMAAAEKVRKAIEAQLEAINKLPAAILRKAFSGEL